MNIRLPAPALNPNDDAVLVVRWLVEDGARVAAGDAVVDIETTKAVATVEAPAAGVLRRVAREGEEIAIGESLAELEGVTDGESSGPTHAGMNAGQTRLPGGPVAKPVAPHLPVTALRLGEAGAAGAQPVRLSLAAARLAAERGLDPASPFPGAAGLVNEARLRAEINPAKGGDTTRRERTPADKRAEIAALTSGAVGGLRSSLTVYFDSAPVRAALGPGRALLPVVLTEAARLLAARPALTAWHEDGATCYHDAVHLGVAVDAGEGLRVVVLRDAASVTESALEERLAGLVSDCVERRLAPDAVTGSTFTVTDLSGLDVLHFEPLLNARQSAILGIGGDARLPGWPMSLTLAFDHRVLTGREAAEFLRALREALERRAEGASGELAGEWGRAVPVCDRCAVPAPEYYARFGRHGVLLQYCRADGGTGLLCHACLALG